MTFVVAPHVAFTALVNRSEEFEHPPGYVLAQRLAAELLRVINAKAEIDNWRDVGWCLWFQHAEKPCEIYFAAQRSSERWLLAIASRNQPGVFRQLLAQRPYPVVSEMRSLAQVVEHGLVEVLHATELRWCLNGFPDREPFVATASLLPWPAEVSAA